LSPGFENSKIFFVAKLKSVPIRSQRASESKIDFIRMKFLEAINGITPDAAGLVAGLSIGETSRISPDLVEKFKQLSLTHLTAVSGTNCAIVLGMVWLILPKLRIGKLVITRRPRLGLAAATLLGYVALVGFQSSVLRAGAMTFAVLLAKTLGRHIQAISALLVAALFLLVFDPWLVFDYGFLLSVLACVGILILAPRLAAWLRSRVPWLPVWVSLAVSVSLSAQVLCFPVLLLLQPGFSTYSVLANLLAEPFVAPITVIGIVSVAVSLVFPPLAKVLTFSASLFAQPILWVADLLTTLPYVTGYWPSGFHGIILATTLAVGLVVMAKLRDSWFRGLVTGGCLLVVLLVLAWGSVAGIRSATWARADWFMVSCDVGQGDATVIRSQGKIALVDVGRDPELIDRCLRQIGVTEIDLLVLTHFDLDHVAGLSGALANRQIEMAMLTSFVDDRPGAEIATNRLDDLQISTIHAETGLMGELGGFRWQVLSPHRGAPEAEDSNDGSVTMLWRSSGVDIITLADLGEKGQMRLAAESASWIDAQLLSVPLIMKVSHHGSADQYPELIESLNPMLATVSVGRGNSYGHPTKRVLELLATINCTVARTDQHGSIAVALDAGGFALGFEGEQGKTG
jgi:competence protein ComEC